MTGPRVFLRDASAYDRPEVRSPKKWHWPDPAETLSLCGRAPLASGYCGSDADPAIVPALLRCRRPGCRQQWAAFMTERREAQTRRAEQ